MKTEQDRMKLEQFNRILNELIQKEQEELCLYIDTGMFNKILIGYVKLLTEHQTNQEFIISEFKKLLETTSAEEVLKIADL